MPNDSDFRILENERRASDFGDGQLRSYDTVVECGDDVGREDDTP
jgi:hypothetical protein